MSNPNNNNNVPTNEFNDENGDNFQMNGNSNSYRNFFLYILMLYLLMSMDPHPPSSSAAVEAPTTEIILPDVFHSKLNNIIEMELHKNPILRRNNVTNKYRGQYHSHIVDMNGTHSVGGNSESHWNKLGLSSGYIDLQLETVDIANTLEMQYVYGIMKLRGAGTQNTLIFDSFQGVYLPKLNKFTMLSTPLESDHVTMVLLEENQLNTNSSVNATANGHMDTHLNALDHGKELTNSIAIPQESSIFAQISRQLYDRNHETVSVDYGHDSNTLNRRNWDRYLPLDVLNKLVFQPVADHMDGQSDEEVDNMSMLGHYAKVWKQWVTRSDMKTKGFLAWTRFQAYLGVWFPSITTLAQEMFNANASASASADVKKGTEVIYQVPTADRNSKTVSETASVPNLKQHVGNSAQSHAGLGEGYVQVNGLSSVYLVSTTAIHNEDSNPNVPLTSSNSYSFATSDTITPNGVEFVFQPWYKQNLLTPTLLETILSEKLTYCTYRYDWTTNADYAEVSGGPPSNAHLEMLSLLTTGMNNTFKGNRQLRAATKTRILPKAKSLAGDIQSDMCYHYAGEGNVRSASLFPSASPDAVSGSILKSDSSPQEMELPSHVTGTGGTRGLSSHIPVFERDSSLVFDVNAEELSIELDYITYKSSSYGILCITVLMVQIYLMATQMKLANTPAVASKISLSMLNMQMLIDLLVQFWHLLFLSSGSGPSAVTAQFYFIVIIGGSLALWAMEMVQVAKVFNATYSNVPGAMDLRTFMWRTQLWLVVVFFSFLFAMTLFPQLLVFMIMALYSFYIPQIISNVRSNKKRSLHWSFILGMGVTRLFFPLYVLGCPKNVFILTLEIPVSSYSTKHGINIGLCVLLGVWMGIQMLILFLQDSFGARFFLPKHWFPMAYDYYRPIPRDVLQNNSNGSEVVNDSGIELANANANQTVVNRRHNSPTNANLSPDGPNMGNTLSQPADTNTSSSAGSPLMGIWSSFSHARWNPFNSGYEAVNTSTTNAASHTQIDFLDVENPVLDNLENSNGGDRAVHRTTDNNPDNVIGECCICYNGVLHNPSDAARMPNHQNVDSSTSTARSNGSLISSLIDQSLNRQHPLRYMITPCNHIFHKECLEQWMEIKLECPVCRASLPLVED